MDKQNDRAFDAAEIKAAIANYKTQQATLVGQHQQLQQQIKYVEDTLHMINGAIQAFETLLTSPLPCIPSEPPAPVIAVGS